MIYGSLINEEIGAIDMVELKETLQYVKKQIMKSGKNIMSNSDLQKMFDEMDQDGDGEVSFSEFKFAMIKSKVVSSDPNNDSALTLQFLKEYAMDKFRVDTLKKLAKSNSTSSQSSGSNNNNSNSYSMSNNSNSNSNSSNQELSERAKFNCFKSIFQTHASIHSYDSANNNEMASLTTLEEFNAFKDKKTKFELSKIIPSRHMVFVGLFLPSELSAPPSPESSPKARSSSPSPSPSPSSSISPSRSSSFSFPPSPTSMASSPTRSRSSINGLGGSFCDSERNPYCLEYPFDMKQIWEFIYSTGVASRPSAEDDADMQRLHCMILTDPSRPEYRQLQELGALLLSFGHSVSYFQTGVDMLNKIVESAFDICFMSGDLPVFDSPGAIRLLTEFEIPILRRHFRPVTTVEKVTPIDR